MEKWSSKRSVFFKNRDLEDIQPFGVPDSEIEPTVMKLIEAEKERTQIKKA